MNCFLHYFTGRLSISRTEMIRMEQYRRNKKIIFVFLLPALLVYIIFECIPVLQSFYFSFFEWPGIQGVPLKYVGIDNFVALIKNTQFHQAMRNILLFVFVGLLTQLPIGFFFAILLYYTKHGQKFFKAVYFIPMILPVTATGLLWQFILKPNETGVLNNLLMKLGMENLCTGWLVDSKTAMICIILVTTWASVAYYIVIGLAALNSIPEDVLESATIDGANTWKKVIYIMIPMIWESIKISVVMIITGVLKVFDMVFVMTEGGPNGLTHVPATLLYSQAFKYNHYGIGSAISTVMFLMSLALTIISLKIMNRDDEKKGKRKGGSKVWR